MIMRKIIVTGGSRGIGAAIVEKFAASGDLVAFVYKSSREKAEELALRTGAVAVCANMSDSTDACRAINECAERLGGLDVLVNCAGIAQIKLFTDITDDEWRQMLDTDLSGAFYACRTAAPYMIRKKGGRIINIGSVWGKHGASCEVHYSAAKAGLRGLTMSLAKELGPSGITVNCVEPGVIATEMNACLDQETLVCLCDETPLCRLGECSDVANAVYFLASDEAAFITGQCIGVDGGFNL